MATVDLTNPVTSGATNIASSTRSVRFVELNVRAVDAAAKKGSALANADVIQLMDLPAGTYIEGATLEVVTADTNVSADVTADIGYTSNTDVFIDGADLATAGFAATGTNGDFVTNSTIITSADTLQLTLGQAVSFASSDDWEIRVFAKVTELSTAGRARAAKDARA